MTELVLDDSKEIRIYSTEGCTPCEVLEDKLEEKGIEFEKTDLRKDKKAQERIMKEVGHLAVPIIEVDGEIEQVGI